MSQLKQQQIGSATGLYNLMLNIGGSIGIALVTTMVARGADASGAHGGAFDADRPGVHATAGRRATRAGAADRSGDRLAPGLRTDLRHAERTGAFVGVCGHVPRVRVSGAVLPAADFAVQARQTRAGAAGGRALKWRMGKTAQRRQLNNSVIVRKMITRLG